MIVGKTVQVPMTSDCQVTSTQAEYNCFSAPTLL
eukprot:SAG31_NODE_48340_length_193_cov_38.989362_2_plen_33_part_01